MYRNTHLDSDKNNMREFGKKYKKTVNKQFNQYKKEFHNKIRSFKSINPKEYWNMVSSKVNTPMSDVISALLKETFAKHFEKLCNNKKAQNEQFNYSCK